jgi:hypothetical protein
MVTTVCYVSMTGLDPTRGTAENYRAFAREEAAGRSPAYETLAGDVAEDEDVLGFLTQLPPAKRQPNLLFAAARLLLDDVPVIATLRTLVTVRPADLTTVMTTRRTQTNEVGRCATLLPALARVPGPIALIEVGASAGLALLIDHYSYAYGACVVRGTDPDAPVLRCDARGDVPLPDAVPDVVWRAGLDLNPLDVAEAADVEWLSCLVWPGQPERDQRLLEAIATARRDPPRVERGDLLADLPALAASAPAGATVVVFHSAVLAYVDAATRSEFADLVRELGLHWLSNEGVGVLPDVEAPAHDGDPFLLVENGADALAFTHPHGDWIHWVA